jgi:Uma2 family endonuclease
MIRAADAPPLDDRDSLYEVVNGERVEKPMSTYENVLAGLLFNALCKHAATNPIGWPLIEVLFELPGHDRDARPDVAFVSFDRWPQARGIPTSNAWPVIPDLAVEIVSPNDAFRDVTGKLQTYFEAGVRSVWLIDPGAEQVHVYAAPTVNRILARGSDLTDDVVLPGFRLPVADLFPPPYVPQ